jgi:gluconate 2-dehydrogenase gamma chain
MDDPYAVDRRGFLKTTATAAAAATVACSAPEGQWRALTNEEAVTLAAACDQIVPPDDDPGAADAGVVRFIDRQLATREKENLPIWQKGVRGLDAFDDQTALLKAMEAGEVPGDGWEGLEPRAFFDRLVKYTMMGFYGDPRHGGNLRHVSWRMLGIPPAPIRGRLKEVPVASPALKKEEG